MLPESISHWVTVAPQNKNRSAYVSCKSSEKIPTKNQQEVLKQSFDERFNVKNDVAFLWPHRRLSCPTCGNEDSENLTLCRESIIVTETNIIQAKGTFV